MEDIGAQKRKFGSQIGDFETFGRRKRRRREGRRGERARVEGQRRDGRSG